MPCHFRRAALPLLAVLALALAPSGSAVAADPLEPSPDNEEMKLIAEIYASSRDTIESRVRSAVRAKKLANGEPATRYAYALMLLQVSVYDSKEGIKILNDLNKELGGHPLVDLALSRVAVRADNQAMATQLTNRAAAAPGPIAKTGLISASLGAVAALAAAPVPGNVPAEEDPANPPPPSSSSRTEVPPAPAAPEPGAGGMRQSAYAAVRGYMQAWPQRRQQLLADTIPARQEYDRLGRNLRQAVANRDEAVRRYNSLNGAVTRASEAGRVAAELAAAQNQVLMCNSTIGQINAQMETLAENVRVMEASVDARFRATRLPFSAEDELDRLTKGRSVADHYGGGWGYQPALPDAVPGKWRTRAAAPAKGKAPAKPKAKAKAKAPPPEPADAAE